MGRFSREFLVVGIRPNLVMANVGLYRAFPLWGFVPRRLWGILTACRFKGGGILVARYKNRWLVQNQYPPKFAVKTRLVFRYVKTLMIFVMRGYKPNIIETHHISSESH